MLIYGNEEVAKYNASIATVFAYVATDAREARVALESH